MSDTGNPYVTLGIPFGAGRDVAASAFARKARGLRRTPSGPERLQRLTWALNQVEEVLKEPRLALDIYRVPADPEALQPRGGGVLAPLPLPLTRETNESTSQHRATIAAAHREALTTLRTEIAQQAELPAR